MENNHAEDFQTYRATVVERTGDFSFLFQHLRRQKPSGDGWVAACCPFHNDHDPSFAFNRHTGAWACFAGCGKGSPFDFLMVTTGQPFKDVLYQLGDRVGIPRPGKNGFHPNGSNQPVIDLKEIEQMEKDLQANPSVLRYLKEKRGLTDETIKAFRLGFDKSRGRIAIPVFDEKGKAVNIRLYAPKKKPKIQNLKGFGNTPRLFGVDKLIKTDVSQVFLCEGEFDCLLLHQNGFMAVTSTHGCSSFRKEWMSHFKGKDVVIVYDCDEEGQAAVDAIVLPAFKESAVKTLKTVRLPLDGTKEDKDITDFFTKEHSVGGDLFQKRRLMAADLKKLVDDALPLDPSNLICGELTLSDPTQSSDPVKSLRRILNSIRTAEGTKGFEKHEMVAQATAEFLRKQGSFFFDLKSSAEYFCLQGQIYWIGNNRDFNAYLQEIGSFNITNSEGRFFWEYIKNYARRKGLPIKTSSWLYGDPARAVLYVNPHAADGHILRISHHEIRPLENGRNEDKILLTASDRVHPIAFRPEQDIKQGLEFLKQAIYDSAPCAAHNKVLLLCYVVAVFLRDFVLIRPLLRLSGPNGSGKSLTTDAISHLIYGEKVAKNPTSAANYTDASRNPLVILDNKEARDIDRELLHFLLVSCTGIVYEKRKLYSDQDLVREKVNCFVLTNGIESIGKPEIISRQWDILCDKSFFNPDYSTGRQFDVISEHRSEILSAIFKFLANHLLPRLKDLPILEVKLRQAYPSHSKNRTFQCLALVLLIWEELEPYIAFPAGLEEAWLESQQSISDETAHETNIFTQFLTLFQNDSFISSEMGIRPKEFEGRPCFEVTSLQLHGLFSHLARKHGFSQPFVDAKQLGERLYESLKVLKDGGWEVRMRARTLDGTRYHRFFPPNKGIEGL